MKSCSNTMRRPQSPPSTSSLSPQKGGEGRVRGAIRTIAWIVLAFCAGCATVPETPTPSTPARSLTTTQNLYSNDFEQAAAGEIPEEFLILKGKFAVAQDGTNLVLELPGEPLNTFGLLFGPAATDGLSASARTRGTSRGRRYPKMGIGLNGAGGFILWVVPAKGTLELTRGRELKASASYTWDSGAWTTLRLQVRKTGEDRWQVKGKAWGESQPEPEDWKIVLEEAQAPPSGRPSLWGIPYSDTPIQFDDLAVSPASGE